MFKKKFKIEYYPRTNKWAAKYGRGYLKRDYYSGIVTSTFLSIPLMLCEDTLCSTKKEAQTLVDEYKEQHFKKMVQTTIV